MIGLETGSVLGFQTDSQLGVFLFQTLVVGLEGGDFLLGVSDKMTIAIRVITRIPN